MPKRKRKPVEHQRVPALLAAEAGLRCQLYRQGTKVTCGNPATCFRPVLGDLCDEHRQAQGAIRYATERAPGHQTSTDCQSHRQTDQPIERRRKPAA